MLQFMSDAHDMHSYNSILLGGHLPQPLGPGRRLDVFEGIGGGSRPLPEPVRSTTDALKSFLMSRRGEISPQSVGLNGTKRRRSKGLNREDMAELIGVSVKWYTLFETGATRGVSRKFTERVADVLSLNKAQRHYLFGLLGYVDQAEPSLQVDVPPAVRLMVDRMSGVPVGIYSPTLDLLYGNAPYLALFPEPRTDQEYGSNKLWRLFFDPAYRAVWAGSDAIVRRTVAEFRYMTTQLQQSERYRQLVAALEHSPEFAHVWHEGAASQMGDWGSRFAFVLPDGRETRLEMTVMQFVASPGLYCETLVTETAAQAV